MEIIPVAHIRTPFPAKFGIPRQSSLAEDILGTIVFEPPFRDPEAIRGLEGFDYIWLIWEFSRSTREDTTFRSTVRPPRLGGNTRIGVFASRSPFRPNPLGLSCVKIEKIEFSSSEGPLIHVRGVDLLDGTPIYDIKPYIPYADSRPEARSGFVGDNPWKKLEVKWLDGTLSFVKEGDERQIEELLSLDPRPHFHTDPTRIYKMAFKNYDISFIVTDEIAQITSIETTTNGTRI